VSGWYWDDDDPQGTRHPVSHTTDLTVCAAASEPTFYLLGGYDVIANGYFYRQMTAFSIPHDAFYVLLRYVFVDGWESGDVGYVDLGVQRHFRGHFNDAGTTNFDSCGGGNADDWIWASGTVFVPGDTVTVYPGSYLNANPDNESFGITDIEVWAR